MITNSFISADSDKLCGVPRIVAYGAFALLALLVLGGMCYYALGRQSDKELKMGARSKYVGARLQKLHCIACGRSTELAIRS